MFDETLYTILEEEFGDSKSTNRPEELRFDCPHCADEKYKLYINIDKLVFNCYVCEWQGSLFQIFKGKKLPKPKKRKLKAPKIVTIDKDLFIPLETAVSTFSKKAKSYLRNRGIYSFHNLYCGIRGRWIGRIVFPVIENNLIVFATGRTIIGNKTKYLNTENEKSHYVYRLSDMKSSRSIVICEGCLDSLTVAGGISIFGKSLSTVQEMKIRKIISSHIPIYVGLDGDCILTNGVEIGLKLSYSFDRVYLMLIPPKKDLNSLGTSWRKVKTLRITKPNLIMLGSIQRNVKSWDELIGGLEDNGML